MEKNKRANNKKNKRKKKIRNIIIFIVVLILVYFGFKIFIYFDERRIYDLVEIKDVIKIEEIDNSCNVSDGNINLYIPLEFRLNKEMKSNGMVSWYDLNYRGIGERDAAIAFIERDDFKNDIGSFDNKKLDYKLLELNDIDNGYDLVEYYYDNYDKKVSIFSSINEIKLNRMSSAFMSSLVMGDEVYLLEGDIFGILCVGEKIYHSVLFDDQHIYVVDFYNDKTDFFDYDKVIEMISIIEFNK